jgi:hypothetical protein
MSSYSREKGYQRCPACNAISGDDWFQCHPGGCPWPGSPHFDARIAYMLQEVPDVEIMEFENVILQP